MMTEAQRHRVGDLVRGGLLLVGDGYRMRNEELGSTGIPFVRGGDIQDGWINHRTTDHIRPEYAPRVSGKLTQPWDVAFITKGTVGRVGILRPEQPPVVFAPQVAYWRSLDPNRIDRRFLYYLLNGSEFQAALDADKTHGAMVADYVSISQQHDFRLVFPPIDDQRAMVRILGSLDDKIELNRRMNETLEEMARALFKSWFIDFDPVHAKAAGRTPHGMDEATARLFPASFEDPELGTIPKGWRSAPLGDWVEALSGGTPSKSIDAYWNGDIPWISPKAMTSIHVSDSDERVSPEAIGNGTRLAPRGATLVMVRGMGLHSEVRISQAQRDLAFNQDVKALIGKGIDPALLLFALLNAQEDLLGRVESSGHGTGKLPSDILFSRSITMPPERAQALLARPISLFSERIAIARDESHTLASFRDTLLPKLLSGELHIKDAEKFVGQAT